MCAPIVSREAVGMVPAPVTLHAKKRGQYSRMLPTPLLPQPPSYYTQNFLYYQKLYKTLHYQGGEQRALCCRSPVRDILHRLALYVEERKVENEGGLERDI